MKVKTNIKKIFTNLTFAFICIFVVGIMNVSAATLVTTEQELKDAVDGVKVIDGVNFTDTDTTEVKLGSNITLENDLTITAVTNLTLDFNGYVINGHTNSKNIIIKYGKSNSNITRAKLTIKDTGKSAGAMKSYLPIGIKYEGRDAESLKVYDLVIENGSFYCGTSMWSSRIFEIKNELANNNITFNFKIKDGYFYQNYNQGNLLFIPNDLTNNNVNINVNFQKLRFEGPVGSYDSTLVYNSLGLKLSDVVDEESNLILKKGSSLSENVTDLDVLANSKLNNVLDRYNVIEITRKEGFDVTDITLNTVYGYTTVPEGAIIIKNRGANSLKIKTVSVRTNGTDEEKFEIVGPKTAPTLEAGTLDNTSYKIKAKTGLNADTYTGVITVTDENDKTYTATVTLKVAKKEATGVSISMQSYMYGETPSTLNVNYGNLQTGQYKIEYSVKNSGNWSEIAPTKVGLYSVRISTIDENLVGQSWSVDYEIRKNNIEIQIIANNDEWIYDGKNHSNTGYKVKYNGTEYADGTLPTGDKVTAVVTGSVKDVKDTVIGNNVVTSFTITDSNGEDRKDCYVTKTTTAGTLTIKPITTSVSVKADSATKAYDGSALTKSTYTVTGGGILSSDTLTATIEGSQTYVGQSVNKVKEVKVIRDGQDITSNYTFYAHENGNLTVTTASQPLSIADKYVRVNGILFTNELESALAGAYGNVSFEKKSGTAGEYNNETIGGFRAGSSLGTVVMTVKATSFDVNNDGTAEYNETEKDFNIHVVTKETVTISGITNNQEFTYNGHSKTPTGTITVTDNKVAVSDLEVSYTGTGSTTYSSTTAPINAGTYKVTYKVSNSNTDYVGEATFNFTIKKLQLSKVTLNEDSFEYTGEDIRIEQLNNWDAMLMSVTGDYNKTNVGNYTITVSLNEEFKKNYEWIDGTTSNLTLNWSITKAVPNYDIPTNLIGLKGQKLSDITLPSGFTWNDASTRLTVGTHTYKAKYTPSDTDNYNVIENIDITVVTKDIFNVTTSVTSGEGTVNGPFMNVVEGSIKEIIFTPETGFMIDKVLVNEVETTVTDNKLTLTVNEDKNIKVSYKKIPFTITVVDTKGVTITPEGIVIVNYGETKEFTITTNSGYRFIKVLVNNVDKTGEMTSDKLTLNNITTNMEIEVVVEKIVYEVIEGANQTYTVTKDKEAEFRIDAEYGMFEDGGKVYVDDELVDSENYTSKEGSTIITLKQSYVDTLSVGEHTLKVVFADDGVATTNFTIEKITPVIDNPKTGDNIGLYITTGILSVIGLLGTSVFVIRRKQEN